MSDLICLDESGKVLALPGMEGRAPWRVLRSTKFPDSYFFSNTETGEACWSMEKQVWDEHFLKEEKTLSLPLINPQGPWPKNAAEQIKSPKCFHHHFEKESKDDDMSGSGSEVVYSTSIDVPNNISSRFAKKNNSNVPESDIHQKLEAYDEDVKSLTYAEETASTVSSEEGTTHSLDVNYVSKIGKSVIKLKKGPSSFYRKNIVKGMSLLPSLLARGGTSSNGAGIGGEFSGPGGGGRTSEKTGPDSYICKEEEEEEVEKKEISQVASTTTTSDFENDTAITTSTPAPPLLQEQGVGPVSSPSTEQKKYRVTDGLGVGGFATVVKVEDTVSGYAYAMKVISKGNTYDESSHYDRLKLELNIMQTATASSPFLQHCYDAFENSANVFFVVELINGGDLFFHLTERLAKSPKSNIGFQENEARVLLSEIYLGLEHLHAQGYVHRDVKIENIMINRSGHVKIVDYGLAVKLESEVQSMKAIGSVIYMAPELVSEHKGGRHTDWWAYGILAHELLTGKIPWSSLTHTATITREITTMQVCPPSNISATAGQFVTSLLKHNVPTRLGTCFDAEIKKAKFFKPIDWERAAQLQAPSAFIPGSICLAEPDRVESIRKYNELVSQRNRQPVALGLKSAKKFLV